MDAYHGASRAAGIRWPRLSSCYPSATGMRVVRKFFRIHDQTELGSRGNRSRPPQRVEGLGLLRRRHAQLRDGSAIGVPDRGFHSDSRSRARCCCSVCCISSPTRPIRRLVSQACGPRSRQASTGIVLRSKDEIAAYFDGWSNRVSCTCRCGVPTIPPDSSPTPNSPGPTAVSRAPGLAPHATCGSTSAARRSIWAASSKSGLTRIISAPAATTARRPSMQSAGVPWTATGSRDFPKSP